MQILRLASVILAFISISSCTIWPIGEDPKGKTLRRQADNIHQAILNFNDQNDKLPNTLQELIPQYLDQLPEVAEQMHYDKDKRDLSYVYSPSWPNPGQVSCGINIGSNVWSCHGYI